MKMNGTPKAGRPRLIRLPKDDLARLYAAGLSIRAIAEALTDDLRRIGRAEGLTPGQVKALRVSKDAVARGLVEYGIGRRPRTFKRSVLADIPLELLEANVRAEGMKAHARRLGVAPATLRAYIKGKGGGAGRVA
jgi:hypothetical protein